MYPKGSAIRTSFRAFSIADVALFRLNAHDRELLGTLAGEFASWADKTKEADYERRVCVTTLFAGQPLFIAGYYEIAKGTAHVFVVPDRRALKRFPKALVRAVTNWLRWVEGRPWCDRIETASLPLSHIDRWMVSLGFGCEGGLTSYTGREYKLWSRVKLNGTWGSVQETGSADELQQRFSRSSRQA